MKYLIITAVLFIPSAAFAQTNCVQRNIAGTVYTECQNNTPRIPAPFTPGVVQPLPPPPTVSHCVTRYIAGVGYTNCN
jgi:hypothetical protein